jgi:hypothetical protein
LQPIYLSIKRVTPSKSCLLSSKISAMLFMVQSSDMNAWFCGDYHDFIISIRVVPFLLITAQCFQRNSCSLRLRSMSNYTPPSLYHQSVRYYAYLLFFGILTREPTRERPGSFRRLITGSDCMSLKTTQLLWRNSKNNRQKNKTENKDRLYHRYIF